MLRNPGPRLLLTLTAFLAVAFPGWMVAQQDPNDIPLGDIARNLRKKTPPEKQVVDDDNLSQVMQQAETGRGFGSALKFLMVGESKGFQVAAPDVTCSLSFSANVKSLLSSQYSQMDLPLSEMGKLQAQATIEGDALTVPVFNGTEWHLSELAVALTVIRKNNEIEADPLEQVRAEKKPDSTVIYKMRAAAPPWQPAMFSARLNTELAPGEEWHWAIVQAKGYPPESYASKLRKSEKKNPTPLYVPSSLTDPENPLAVTPEKP